jgi:hypothetical protein
MPAEPISGRAFYAYAHPLQKRRFYLALVFSIMLFPLIAAGLIAGTVFLIVPAVAFLLWVGMRILFARLLGNSILVSEVNYPRIHQIAQEMKDKIGYEKRVYIFVYEQGSFNAYMGYFFFRRAIFLNSELLESGVSDDEVRWLIGRFVGYLRARKQAGILGWVIRAAQKLVVFNLFLLPYERAMVYTGDRLAVAAINGDISSATSAMQKLLVGRQLGYSVNPTGIIEQQRQVKGSIFALLARMMSGFPHMTSRYISLITFAKAYFPAQFVRFEAANPGLPADLAQLAAAPEAISGDAPPNPETAGRPPHGWVWAGGTAIALAAVGLFTWSQFSPEAAVWHPPAGDAVAAAQTDVTPTRLPHLHRDASGLYVPDPGCHRLTNNPNDMRVRCE